MKNRLPFKLVLVLGVTVALAAPALANDALTTVITPGLMEPDGANHAVEIMWLNHASTASTFVAPETLEADLRQHQRAWRVELRLQKTSDAPILTIKPGGFVSQTYVFTCPADVHGTVALYVEHPLWASALIDIDPFASGNEMSTSDASATNSLMAADRPALAHLQRAFVNHFGFHEPIYFLYGADDPVAKFQFSLRYRLLGRTRGPDDMEPPARGLYLGYTQRSLWDIDGDSSPFYDTSYMPEVFFEGLAPSQPDTDRWFHWLGFHAGVKHESNGKDGDDSRSLNLAYVRPGVAFGSLDGWHLVVVPRIFAYFGTSSNNDDIEDYRGYGELMCVLGRDDGLQVSALGMIGKDWDKGSIQIDVSHPIRIPRVEFDTYLHIQYFNGYGESLRDYAAKSSTWRAGFSIVR